jgi:hypothetical protein
LRKTCRVFSRVARFFGTTYQNKKNNHILFQLATKYIYQITTKYTKWPQNIPNGRNITKLSLNRPTYSIARPSKIYPNWDFWLEICHLAAPVFTSPKFILCFPHGKSELISVINCSADNKKSLTHPGALKTSQKLQTMVELRKISSPCFYIFNYVYLYVCTYIVEFREQNLNYAVRQNGNIILK